MYNALVKSVQRERRSFVPAKWPGSRSGSQASPWAACGPSRAPGSHKAVQVDPNAMVSLTPSFLLFCVPANAGDSRVGLQRDGGIMAGCRAGPDGYRTCCFGHTWIILGGGDVMHVVETLSGACRRGAQAVLEAAPQQPRRCVGVLEVP